MNDGKTQVHQRPTTNTMQDPAKPIGVSLVQFKDSSFEIPGKLQSSALRAEAAMNRPRWRITFVPLTRTLQLEWFASNAEQSSAIYMVPIEAVNWFVPIAG